MHDTDDTVQIDEDEWAMLAALCRHLEPFMSPAFPGVALSNAEARRWWSITTPRLHVDVAGGDVTTDRPGIRLPASLAQAAHELAAIEGVCELIVQSDHVTVRNRWGSERVGRLEPCRSVPRPERSPRVDLPTAQVHVDLFAALLRRTHRSPLDARCAVAAPAMLRIDEGELCVEIEWSRFDLETTRSTMSAETSGSGAAMVPNGELVSLMTALEEEGLVHLTIDHDHALVWLDGSHWTAVVAAGAVASSRPVAASSFDEMVELDGRPVELHRHDDGSVQARCCAARRVHATWELLGELNALNAEGTTRWWLADGELLVAARGFPADTDALRALAGVASQAAAAFGPLLAVLGGVPNGAIPGQLALRLDGSG